MPKVNLGLVGLALLALAACRTAPPPPPAPDAIVTATSDSNQPVDSFSLAPGEWRDYLLNIPAGLRATYDVVYLELANAEPGAVVELRNGAYWHVLASSAVTSRFVRGRLPGVPQPLPQPSGEAEAAGAEAVAPAGITTSYACVGPCVIFRPSGGDFYARVVNDGGTLLSADLHFYGLDLQDETEPQNDSRVTAPVLAAENAGAIELLGDVDYWVSADDLAVTLEANAGVDAEAVVVSSSGLVVAGPYASGEAFAVFDGEALRVRAVGADRAGAAGASVYYLFSEPLPPGTPGRPPSDIDVTATTNPNALLDIREFAAGQTIEYLLELPSNVRVREVLYVELTREVGLELRSGSGLSAIASSYSSDRFRSGSGGFSATAEDAGSELGAAAVDVLVNCRGSCVLVEPGSSSYRVLVTNTGGPQTIGLYAYGTSFMDKTEPANDATNSAPVLTDTDGGAIETIGDADYWRLAYGGTLAFDAAVGGITLEAEIVDASGKPVPASGGPYLSGASFLVLDGEYLRVWARNSGEAAAAANSAYYLDYQVFNSNITER